MKTPQTPFTKLGMALGLTSEVWLKREDLHPAGSHKGRSIPLMIAEHHRNGIKSFVISSSGNAALAALFAVQEHNRNNASAPLALTIFVGNKINPEKLALLKKTCTDTHIEIVQTEKPKHEAFQKEKLSGAKFLRQSVDDLALVGYGDLALELGKIPGLAVVFIPTSSGTTAQGLWEGFQKNNLKPQIHIVQTTSCHPFIENAPASTEVSVASAIVDKVARRKQKIIEVIKNSLGAGYVATNAEIIAAQKLVRETCDLEISANSALSIAGLQQALRAGWKPTGAVACVITGR